jgi:flavin-dependent thymidylate synthase
VTYHRSRPNNEWDNDPILADKAFNRHSMNTDGRHTAPGADAPGVLQVGTDGLRVKLLQGVDEESFRRVLSRATRATTGVSVEETDEGTDWEEMMRGGLQAALESQTVVFEVWGASRALTHQLVRSRRAGFHQQSQRATFYGNEPDVRMPESVFRNPRAREAFEAAAAMSARAYRVAAEEDISYQDARFILPEGTTNYIVCEYTVREFLAVYAYRACSMFMWEMVSVMRSMGKVLAEAHPFLEPYIKISCEKTGSVCPHCSGDGKLFAVDPAGEQTDGDWRGWLVTCPMCSGAKRVGMQCTFQGWESVEGQCGFPWAKQDRRTFLPTPKFRIEA